MKQICATVFSFIVFGALWAGLTWAQSSQWTENQHRISFKGGPGDSPKTAVIINGATNSIDGVSAEYHYLKQKFGRENIDWNLRRQSVLQQDGKVYDRMELDLKDGSKKTIFFDIGQFFGKL